MRVGEQVAVLAQHEAGAGGLSRRAAHLDQHDARQHVAAIRRPPWGRRRRAVRSRPGAGRLRGLAPHRAPSTPPAAPATSASSRAGTTSQPPAGPGPTGRRTAPRGPTTRAPAPALRQPGTAAAAGPSGRPGSGRAPPVGCRAVGRLRSDGGGGGAGGAERPRAAGRLVATGSGQGSVLVLSHEPLHAVTSTCQPRGHPGRGAAVVVLARIGGHERRRRPRRPLGDDGHHRVPDCHTKAQGPSPSCTTLRPATSRTSTGVRGAAAGLGDHGDPVGAHQVDLELLGPRCARPRAGSPGTATGAAHGCGVEPAGELGLHVAGGPVAPGRHGGARRGAWRAPARAAAGDRHGRLVAQREHHAESGHRPRPRRPAAAGTGAGAAHRAATTGGRGRQPGHRHRCRARGRGGATGPAGPTPGPAAGR